MTLSYYRTVVAEISGRVQELSRSRQVILIGIDGCGGSGKSTLARELSESMGVVPIVPHDDFYKPSEERRQPPEPHVPGWQFDWQRLEAEVLKTLRNNGIAHYRRYDWPTDRLAETRTIHANSAVIIEGVYTLRPELLSYYDLRCWVECPKEICLQRGIARDGEQIRGRWENDWRVEEEKYMRTCSPYLHADIIIEGTSVGVK